ncbi:MAG: hypothetical protein HY319_27765 [Armatimonadetes bacterium]|nr:hypothetical protein [Armatimonadota bacterium]
MISNEKISSVLRKDLGGSHGPDALVSLIVSLVPIGIVAILVFVIMRDQQGDAPALGMGLGAFAVLALLGYCVGGAVGDQVGIADVHTERAMRASESFLHRDRVDDHLAAGFGVVAVQFFCGGIYSSVQAMQGKRPGGLSDKHFRIAVGALKAVLDNNGVERDKLVEALTEADPSLAATEADSVLRLLIDKGYLAGAGATLTVPPEKVHEFYS